MMAEDGTALGEEGDARAPKNLRVVYRSVDDLAPSDRNARTHSDAQVDQIAASIREFGFTNPILVDGKRGVLAGHGRLMAARKLGLQKVPTIEIGHLSAAQRRAYMLADNRLALSAGWDETLLRLELGELRAEGFDLALTGFDGAELEHWLAEASSEAADTSEQPASTALAPAASHPDGEDPADDLPEPKRQVVSRAGDLWLLGEHRLLCGDSTDGATVRRVIGAERAALIFTSPPYGNQRDYTTGGVSDWDRLMQGVFGQMTVAARDDAQVLVNLGQIHRDGEWLPYWQGWLDWMRGEGWRRFGFYVWDQGPGLPGDWNGRLAPAFEMIFHFNRQSRQANKIVPCKWAGTENKGSGLRAADGTITPYQHAGMPVQDFRIPDNVLRISRHKGRGIETEHPAVFPVALPEFVMRTYSNEGEVVFEPFGGSGSSILAGQRTGRRVRAIDLAPAYVDLAIARWRLLHPEIPVRLEDGREFDEVARARSVEMADAA